MRIGYGIRGHVPRDTAFNCAIGEASHLQIQQDEGGEGEDGVLGARLWTFGRRTSQGRFRENGAIDIEGGGGEEDGATTAGGEGAENSDNINCNVNKVNDNGEDGGWGGFQLGPLTHAIFLDLPEPWLAIPHAAHVIRLS